MFGHALMRVRGASRVQVQSLLCPSARHTRDVIAFTARSRRGEGSNGSQYSNKSSGHGQGDNSRLPLRPTAVAAISFLAGAVNPDHSEDPPRPPYAFRDPSGWDHWASDPSIFLDLSMRIHRGMANNSIEEACSAHFEYTREFLKFCVRGELVDEGSLPNDTIFGYGWYVKKEDTKIFWLPSPEHGKSSILCLSVHYDLLGDGRDARFLAGALGPQLCERLLEKFKDESGTRIFVHVHFPTGFFLVGIPREELVNMVEREKCVSDIPE